MRVLVVDDDKLARKGLISIMNWEKYGFEVGRCPEWPQSTGISEG